MPIPNSPDFTGYDISYSRDQICTDALILVGRIGDGQTPTSSLLSTTADTLNLILASLETELRPRWNYIEDEITASANSESYTFNDHGSGNKYAQQKIIYIEDAWARVVGDTGRFYPLDIETTAGIRDRFYWEGQEGRLCKISYVGDGKFVFLPTPDQDYTIRYRALVSIRRLTSSGADLGNDSVFGAPSRWFNFFKWALATELCTVYKLPLNERQYFEQKANQLFMRGRDGDAETQKPRKITPAFSSGRNYKWR